MGPKCTFGKERQITFMVHFRLMYPICFFAVEIEFYI